MVGVDGIISGIKTSSIISQLMNVARAPIRSMQAGVSRLEARQTAMQELNTLLTALQSSIAAVDTVPELGAFGANSSQAAALDVSVTGNPQPGSHTVEVLQLAENTLIRSVGLASTTDPLQTGTLSLTINSITTAVPIQAANGTDTPQGLVDYINNNVSGANAYLLDTGVGSTPLRLMIQGSLPGAQNQVTFSVTADTTVGRALAPTTLRAGQDAQLTLDSTTVYTPSNSPADLLPGLQLDLKNVTTGPAQITTTRDNAAMAAKIDDVVTAYNELQAFVAKQSDPTAPGPLAGDSTVRTVSRRLQNILASDYGSTTLAGIGSLGLTTAQTGVLSFDSTAFGTHATADFGATMDALTGPAGLFGVMSTQLDLITDTTTGLIQPRITSFDDQIAALNDKIDGSQFRLGQYEESLRQQFTAMELILAKYQSTGDFLAAQLNSFNRN